MSCSSKKNNEYNSDYTTMNSSDFARKYFTLYNEPYQEPGKIKINKAYYTIGNNYTFSIVVFGDNNFVYESGSMSEDLLGTDLKTMRLGRNSYYRVTDTLVKMEGMAMSPPGGIFNIIEEGVVRNDTIFMQKRYDAKGYKNSRKLSNAYILLPRLKVFVMGENVFIEGSTATK
jgi:hypothetical protein